MVKMQEVNNYDLKDTGIASLKHYTTIFEFNITAL